MCGTSSLWPQNLFNGHNNYLSCIHPTHPCHHVPANALCTIISLLWLEIQNVLLLVIFNMHTQIILLAHLDFTMRTPLARCTQNSTSMRVGVTHRMRFGTTPNIPKMLKTANPIFQRTNGLLRSKGSRFFMIHFPVNTMST